MYSIDTAIRATAHGTPGKPANFLGEQLGIASYQVFINKTNPNCRSHELKVSELVALMLETGDPQAYHAMGAELRKAGVIGDNGKLSLVDAVMNKVAEGGDVVRVVRDFLKNGGGSPRKKAEILKEISEERASLDDLEDAVNREGQGSGTAG